MNEIVAHRLADTPDICKTLYFWWIAYLRCSPDYWWICKENGQCEDERFIKCGSILEIFMNTLLCFIIGRNMPIAYLIPPNNN